MSESAIPNSFAPDSPLCVKNGNASWLEVSFTLDASYAASLQKQVEAQHPLTCTESQRMTHRSVNPQVAGKITAAVTEAAAS